jgi:hypothetical protein
MSRLSMLAGLLLGLIAGCFTAPSDDVLFSCEQEGDDRCPPDYRCEADDCCHRIGSDVQANFGACALGGNSGSGSSTDSETTNGSTETGTDTGSTGG